jgi:hypothetical protein
MEIMYFALLAGKPIFPGFMDIMINKRHIEQFKICHRTDLKSGSVTKVLVAIPNHHTAIILTVGLFFFNNFSYFLLEKVGNE